MTLRRSAFLVLSVLALLLGANLAAAADRFFAAYDTYDDLTLDMPVFRYTTPDEPVGTELVVGNPSDQQVEVIAVELSLDVGVHRVGGGQMRPLMPIPPGGSMSFPMDLRIFDSDYVERRAGPSPDWRVSGRIQVELDPQIDPVWITFSVRQLPESSR